MAPTDCSSCSSQTSAEGLVFLVFHLKSHRRVTKKKRKKEKGTWTSKNSGARGPGPSSAMLSSRPLVFLAPKPAPPPRSRTWPQEPGDPAREARGTAPVSPRPVPTRPLDLQSRLGLHCGGKLRPWRVGTGMSHRVRNGLEPRVQPQATHRSTAQY